MHALWRVVEKELNHEKAHAGKRAGEKGVAGAVNGSSPSHPRRLKPGVTTAKITTSLRIEANKLEAPALKDSPRSGDGCASTIWWSKASTT